MGDEIKKKDGSKKSGLNSSLTERNRNRFPFRIEQGNGARGGRSRDSWKDKVPKISKASPETKPRPFSTFINNALKAGRLDISYLYLLSRRATTMDVVCCVDVAWKKNKKKKKMCCFLSEEERRERTKPRLFIVVSSRYAPSHRAYR